MAILDTVFCSWSELACKNALSSSPFKEVLEMLAKLFSIYSKSQKKSRESSEIVEGLKMVFDFPSTGNMPVRCQGTHWISHKRKALQCVTQVFNTKNVQPRVKRVY